MNSSSADKRSLDSSSPYTAQQVPSNHQSRVFAKENFDKSKIGSKLTNRNTRDFNSDLHFTDISKKKFKDFKLDHITSLSNNYSKQTIQVVSESASKVEVMHGLQLPQEPSKSRF